MSRRIHFAVFGSGLGHCSRTSLIADIMRRNGNTVNFSSSNNAVDYLRQKGYSCDRVASVDAEWNVDGGVSVSKTTKRTPSLFSRFAQQVRQENQIMSRFKPDLVISDSRLSAVVVASLRGIPSVTIANQLRILLPPLYQDTSLNKIEMLDAEILGFFWSFSKFVLIPDLPPPYTVSVKNIQDIKTVRRKIRYVGFMTPLTIFDREHLAKLSRVLELEKGKKVVFAQISGPTYTRENLCEIMVKAADATSDRFTWIVSRGDVGGNERPLKIKGGWMFQWCPLKDELFALADILIIRGGHSTISTAIMNGKPMITIPIVNHSEQVANSKTVEKMGLGLFADQSMLTSGKLASMINDVIGDEKIMKRILEVKDVANKMNGVENILKRVETLL